MNTGTGRGRAGGDRWVDDRPAPAWLGDVAAGVEAWTSGASGTSARPASAGSGRASTPPPEDTLALGPEADAESVARTILLDQLTGRARSRAELRDKLAAKGVPDEIGARLLDRFEEVGLVDDEAFARSWVAARGAEGHRRLARRALGQELRRKGVADEVVRTALDDVDPAAEEAAARALVERKLRSLARVDDATATRRLVGMLARKGYPAGLAHTVVRDALRAADRDGVEVPEPD